MSMEFWFFVFAAVQAFFSIFAGLQFFGITANNMKTVSFSKWLVVMLFLWMGSLGVSAYGFYSISTSQGKWRPDIQETIRHHTYVNESVEIDGKEFDQCSFENATLVYRGTGIFKFNKVIFKGATTAIQTDNRAAKWYSDLRDFLSSLPQAAGIVHGRKNIDTGELTVHLNQIIVKPGASQLPPPATTHDPKFPLP